MRVRATGFNGKRAACLTLPISGSLAFAPKSHPAPTALSAQF